MRSNSSKKDMKQHANDSITVKIREGIDGYFNLVTRNIRDTIPKIIG